MSKSFGKNEDSTAPEDLSRHSLRALTELSHPCRDVKSFNKNEDSVAPKDGSHFSLRALLSRTISSVQRCQNRSARTKIRLLLTMVLIIHWEPCCPELCLELYHPCRNVKSFNKNEDSTAPNYGSHYSLRALLSRTISSIQRCQHRSRRMKIRLLLTMALIIHWEPCRPEPCLELYYPCRDVKSFSKNEDSTAPNYGSHYSLRALLSRTISSVQRCRGVQQERRFDCS